jgi:membrane protease YdiL (CAAX protease family)
MNKEALPTVVADRPAETELRPSLSLKMLAPDTRAAMYQVAERIEVPGGTLLFTEDEQSNELYIIESGKVTSYQAGGEDDAEWPVLELGAGDIVGEMSFLDGGVRQLNARAEVDTTLLRIHPFDLLEVDGGDLYYDNLRASVGIAVVQRLRVGTELHVATLQHQLELVQKQKQFGMFFLFTITLFSIAMVANNVISTQILKVDINTQLFAWQYLLVLLVPSLIVVWLMKIPISQIGLTTKGLRKSLTEGAVTSLAAVALTAAIVAGSRMTDAIPDLRVSTNWSETPAYFLHSFLQEVVARGFMQSAVQRFLDDRRGVRTVILTSTMFGVFHIHFGLAAVIVTIISCIIFGLFYLRHENIFGVTLLHFFLGACAFSIGIL